MNVTATDTVLVRRRELIGELFPEGIPRLWCPFLTHFTSNGAIDYARMAVHFETVVPWVKGFFIPGTTGDGWDLNEGESIGVARFALEAARKHKIKLLLGAMRTDAGGMDLMISTLIALIRSSVKVTGTDAAMMVAASVCGFVVCPPKGKNCLQPRLEDSLSSILDRGLPMALYQLPLMTENELAPETFKKLADRYPNLIFFKDSSGGDRIALTGMEGTGIFLFRGAEGNYAQWLKEGGGCYDGLLLSTANCFAPEFTQIIGSLEKKDFETARDISERLTQTLHGAFALVGDIPCGNAFTNANKAFDHFFAYGPKAQGKEGPMLRGGIRISDEIIAAVGDLLRRYQLMPEKGYLE